MEAEPFDIRHTILKPAETKIDLREHDLKQALFSDFFAMNSSIVILNSIIIDCWLNLNLIRFESKRDPSLTFVESHPNARVQS